ncbi:MAG: hypothetical protein R8M14_01865 [Ghiorsea sp.]
MAKSSANGRVYLTFAAILTLILLAWHFSIQAAAHDAAIAQVRTWMKEMGATAGRVQFRLLRGALTIENINMNIWGAPLTIQSLIIKGNPASITTSKPLLQYIRVQNMAYRAKVAKNQWENLSLQLPSSIQTIFRYAKTIDISDSIFYDLPNYSMLTLDHLQITGPANLRQLLGHGTQQYHEEIGEWYIKSTIPENISQQNGKFITSSLQHHAELSWSGSWNKQNMLVNYTQNDDAEGSKLVANLSQHKNKWLGDIQTQSWPIHLENMDSLLTGLMHISGKPMAWSIQSEKLQWAQTSFNSEQNFIQSMTSYDINIQSQGKEVSIQRLDINDTNFLVSPNSPILKSSWNLALENINLNDIYVTFEDGENATNLPPMSGIASIKQGQFTFDISDHENNDQFWRIHGQADEKIILNATHIPLIHLRNILPPPFLSEANSIQGKVNLNLLIQPNQQFKTSGEISISDLSLSANNQTFSAKTLGMTIHDANTRGVQIKSIYADEWNLQVPLTPKQAWSGHSYLDTWASIPWSIDHLTLTQGRVLIGNKDNLWLDDVLVKLQHWQSEQPASLSLSGQIGLAPFQAHMSLVKDETQSMQWQSLSAKFLHANMFFLENWLQLSNFPLISQGHFSVMLKAARNINHIQGNINLQLHHIHFQESGAKMLQQLLNYPIEQSPMKFAEINTPFEGQGDWTALAGDALLASAKAGLEKQPESANKGATAYKRLGSLRIQQDIRLSLNERTRLRKIIRSLKHRKKFAVALTPEIGISPLTPTLKEHIIQTQNAIQTFMQKRGINRKYIYTILPQTKHRSNSDVGAVHINLVK